MNQPKTKAFTLVELIVVITILAILGTIAFMSLQGYSKTARNSRRITDINNIKSSLELFSIKTGKYPLPDDSETVSYSGEILRTQGIVGDIVTRNLSSNLNKKPTDPLFETEYIYSVSNTQKEYEILSFFEGLEIASNPHPNLEESPHPNPLPKVEGTRPGLVNQANASNIYTPKINGNYNGIYLKTKKHIVPSPSIINAEINGTGLILTDENIKSQVVSNGENFPNINNQTSIGKLDIKLSPYKLISSESSPEDKLAAIEAIQNAYSGTILANKPTYKYLLSKTSDDDKLILVEKAVLHNDGEVELAPVNGECGNDNGLELTTLPTNLCITGTPTSIFDGGIGGNYIWDCQGRNNGYDFSCSAGHVKNWDDGVNYFTFGTLITYRPGNSDGSSGDIKRDLNNSKTYCNNLTLGGKSDWYLPLQSEMNIFISNKGTIGGFVSDFYWVSDWSGSSNIGILCNFGTNSCGGAGSSTALHYSRCVRQLD